MLIALTFRESPCSTRKNLAPFDAAAKPIRVDSHAKKDKKTSTLPMRFSKFAKYSESTWAAGPRFEFALVRRGWSSTLWYYHGHTGASRHKYDRFWPIPGQ